MGAFYFSEEILSQEHHKKSIVVSDRATLFNLLIGLDGYTIATGILNSNLNGDNIVSIPLDIDDPIELVYIKHEKASLSKMGDKFIEYLLEEVQFDKWIVKIGSIIPKVVLSTTEITEPNKIAV